MNQINPQTKEKIDDAERINHAYLYKKSSLSILMVFSHHHRHMGENSIDLEFSN